MIYYILWCVAPRTHAKTARTVTPYPPRGDIAPLASKSIFNTKRPFSKYKNLLKVSDNFIYTALFSGKIPQHKTHTIRRYILYIITEKAILHTIYSSYCYAKGWGYLSNSHPVNNLQIDCGSSTHPTTKIPLFLTPPPFLFHTTKFLLHKHIVFYHHFLISFHFPKFIYKVQTFPHQYDDLVRTTVYIIYIIYSLDFQYDSCMYQKIIFIVFYATFYMNFINQILQSLCWQFFNYH